MSKKTKQAVKNRQKAEKGSVVVTRRPVKKVIPERSPDK